MQDYQRNLQQIAWVIRDLPSGADPALTAIVAQHLCVRLSGTLELAIRSNIIRTLEKSSSPRAIRFINKKLAEFQNPKPERIIRLFEEVDKTWAEQIKDFWEPEVKDAIGSIVGQRNVMAHGGSTDVTIVRVKGWFEKTKQFCTHLEGLT
jgi:hypothetical protein